MDFITNPLTNIGGNRQMGTALTFARLAYECVKEAIPQMDRGFTYQVFIGSRMTPDDNADLSKDQYVENSDFLFQYEACFNAINLGLARLSDYGKVPYEIVEVDVTNESDGTKYVEFPTRCRRIINIFIQLRSGEYKTIPFRLKRFGRAKLAHLITPNIYQKVFIEYAVEFPLFTQDDIHNSYIDDDGNLVDPNEELCNLEDYGIDSGMYAYLKEYAKANIIELFDPAIASNKLNIAENYFDNLPVQPSHSQYRVTRKGL